MHVSFEQATIKVEKEREFANCETQSSGPFPTKKESSCNCYRARMSGFGIWTLSWKKLIERADEALAKSGQSAKSLYDVADRCRPGSATRVLSEPA